MLTLDARPLEGDCPIIGPNQLKKKRMKKGPSGRHGFSLIELVICIGIITTGIIFIVEIFTTMLAASTKGADWSVATYVAAGQLDTLVANPGKISDIYSNGAVTASGNVYHSALPYYANAYEPAAVASLNNTTYYITYTIQKLLASQTPQLYDVDAQVQWFGPDPSTPSPGPSATGYGKVSLHMSRLIYVH